MNLLFVTWDGPQVTYLEALFGPILQGLARDGYQIHVLQFTWADDERRRGIARRCEELGLTYEARRILRVPRLPGALATVLLGALHLRRTIRERKIDAVLSRSILPSLATLLALRSSATPVVFDADGLLLDEMVDFDQLSPSGLTYRFLRDVEAMAVRRAITVMTRSAAACETLIARGGAGTESSKFHVVKNGRDPSRYRFFGAEERARVRESLGAGAETPLVVYAGSLGPKYCLVPMLRMFQAIRARREDAMLLVLTTAPEYFHAVNDASLKQGVQLLSVASADVPHYLSASDLGLALIEPAYSMHAASAVKTAEYLLCGLPVIANRGIGDIGDILDSGTGFVVESVEGPDTSRAAAEWFLGEVMPRRDQFRARCRELGEREFSLEQAIASYARALEPVRSLGSAPAADEARISSAGST